MRWEEDPEGGGKYVLDTRIMDERHKEQIRMVFVTSVEKLFKQSL